MEEWAAISGFPEYEVSTLGRVRRCVDSRKYKAGFILTPRKHPRGYLWVSLSANGRMKNKLIHRLVAEAFLGSQPEGMQVAHNDGSRTNNAVGNLRWDTASANNADRVKHGTLPRGEALPQAKLMPCDVRRIRQHVASGGAQKDMAKEFGISAAQVSRIVSAKLWAHV